MYISKEFANLKMQYTKMQELAQKIAINYPSLYLDEEILFISIKKLMWRGFKFSDLASGKFDGIIIDRYQIDLKENNEKENYSIR